MRLATPASMIQLFTINLPPCSTICDRHRLPGYCGFSIKKPRTWILAVLCPCVLSFLHSLAALIRSIPGLMLDPHTRHLLKLPLLKHFQSLSSSERRIYLKRVCTIGKQSEKLHDVKLWRQTKKTHIDFSQSL